MRTAEDILDNISEEERKEIENGNLIIGFRQQMFDRGYVLHKINEARKEAIEECAEKATIRTDWIHQGFEGTPYIDKQSILSLINEIK